MPIQTAQQAISNESPNSSPFGFRNRIQNGEFSVNQRANTNHTFTLTSSGNAFTTVDRWSYYFYNLSGTFTPNVSVKQTSDHPVKGSNGKCLEIVCNTTGATSNSVDFFAMTHGIESQNIADIFSGAVNAQPMTLSFWVKSNKTGTYCVEMRDVQSGGGSTYIIKEYTVNQSGVWEKKVLSIPAPTFSSMPSDNSQGLYIQFMYASGVTPTYNSGIASSINAWSAAYGTNGAASTNQTNLFANAGNYHRLSDVQLEAGTVATSFERRPFGLELQQCQRYFQFAKYYFEYAMGSVGNLAGPTYTFPVPFRAAPSYTQYGSTFGSNNTINGPSSISTGAYYYAFLLGYASTSSGYGYRDVTYAVSSEI